MRPAREWKVRSARTEKTCSGCGGTIRRGEDYGMRGGYGTQCVPCVSRLEELEHPHHYTRDPDYQAGFNSTAGAL